MFQVGNVQAGEAAEAVRSAGDWVWSSNGEGGRRVTGWLEVAGCDIMLDRCDMITVAYLCRSSGDS